MLWTIIIILLVLWALGFGVLGTGGNLIHVLILLAVIVFILQWVRGRGPRSL